MALSQILVYTPDLQLYVRQPLVTHVAWECSREINRAGSFQVSIPSLDFADYIGFIESGWRITVIEEGDADFVPIYQGIVRAHEFNIRPVGTALVNVAGDSRLGALADDSTYSGRVFNGSQTFAQVAQVLANEAVTVPSNTMLPRITFHDETKLAALLKLVELARFNIRETFVNNAFDCTKQDDVPDSGVMFANVEGPVFDAGLNIGYIIGSPTVRYDGRSMVNRIIPIGTDFDGGPLKLDAFTSAVGPYPVLSIANPDSTLSYYLEDGASRTRHGLKVHYYMRTDVKNPSDNATTLAAAKRALYAVATGELRRRRSPTTAVTIDVASSDNLPTCLPGSRVRVRYSGYAIGSSMLSSGVNTWLEVDKDFLISSRHDASSAFGIRRVRFGLVAPQTNVVDPLLPNAIPTPKERDLPKPRPPSTDEEEAVTEEGTPKEFDTGAVDAAVELQKELENQGSYQPCCPDPATDIPGENTGETSFPAEVPEGTADWSGLTVNYQRTQSFPHALNANAIYIIGGFNIIDTPYVLTGTDILITELKASADVYHNTSSTKMAFHLVVPNGPNPTITAPAAQHHFADIRLSGKNASQYITKLAHASAETPFMDADADPPETLSMPLGNTAGKLIVGLCMYQRGVYTPEGSAHGVPFGGLTRDDNFDGFNPYHPGAPYPLLWSLNAITSGTWGWNNVFTTGLASLKEKAMAVAVTFRGPSV